MKSYRLLRNNKESGPYSANDLIQLGLKAYDLIWMEGKTAAWLYPSEIEELKAYAPVVEEQPFDRFYKKKETAEIKPEIKTQPEQVVKAPKPRFKIAAAWNRVDAPAETQVKTAVAVKEAPVQKPSQETIATPSWKEVYSEWKKEPAVTEKIVKPVSVPKVANKEEAKLETKYSRSLDEIKERYVETVLKPRTSKGFSLNVSSKQVLEVILVIPVILFGLWMVFKPEKKEDDKQVAKTQVKEESKSAVQSTGASEENAGDQNISADEKEAIANVPDNNIQAEEKQPAVIKNAAAKPITTNTIVRASKKDSKNNLRVQLATNLANTSKFQKPDPFSTQPSNGVRNAVKREVSNPIASTSKGNGVMLDNTAKENPLTPATAIPAVIKNTAKTVDQLVKLDQLSKYSGVVQDVKLNLQNMTNSMLDLVVVDLQYFDKKGFYKKGETLYIKNVPANRDVVIKTPDDLNAANLTYRVSLISSEQKGLYVVAE